MPPSFLSFKDLRRRSRASFRTHSSTDTSSDGVGSSTTTPSTTGSMTPPSIAQSSDPALDLQLKQQNGSQTRLQRQSSQQQLHSQSPTRSFSQHNLNSQPQTHPHPHPHPQTNPQARPPLSSNSNRNSVSGMSGLGAPSLCGRQNLPVSQYAPRLINITDNAWVSHVETSGRLIVINRDILALLWPFDWPRPLQQKASHRWHPNPAAKPANRFITFQRLEIF